MLDWIFCLHTTPAFRLSSSTEGSYRGRILLPPNLLTSKMGENRSALPLSLLYVRLLFYTRRTDHPACPPPSSASGGCGAPQGLASASQYRCHRIHAGCKAILGFFSYHLQLFLSVSKVLDLEKVNLEGPTDLCHYPFPRNPHRDTHPPSYHS